jgi:hypothetical protein
MADCFAPVVSMPVARLMTALVVRNGCILKQGDCKNAFCHTSLTDDEVTIVRPLANCPISKPNTFWHLNKTPLWTLTKPTTLVPNSIQVLS